MKAAPLSATRIGPDSAAVNSASTTSAVLNRLSLIAPSGWVTSSGRKRLVFMRAAVRSVMMRSRAVAMRSEDGGDERDDDCQREEAQKSSRGHDGGAGDVVRGHHRRLRCRAVVAWRAAPTMRRQSATISSSMSVIDRVMRPYIRNVAEAAAAWAKACPYWA